MEVVYFFFKQVEKKIWLKVFFNYFLISGLIVTELLFLTYFFILVNDQSTNFIDNNLINNFNIQVLNFFDGISYNETLLLLLIFFLILKNFLNLYQVYFQFSFIYALTVKKASNLLKIYLDKNYEDFLKKDISIYIKQITRDIEHVFAGIFGLIISIVGDILYIGVLLFFSLSIIDIVFDFNILLLFIGSAFLINFLFSVSKNSVK